MRKIIVGVFAVVLGIMACACGQSSAPIADAGTSWKEQYDLGVRYLEEGNYEEAIIAFTAAIEIDPKRAPAYVGRGDAYALSGETEENLAAAQADYEKAIELDETNLNAYLGLADVYIRWGEYDKALELLRSARERVGESQEIAEKIAELESGNVSDSAGNVRRMTSYDADGVILYWQDYTYDNLGNTASATSFDANGAQTGHVVCAYDESGRLLVGYWQAWETGEIGKSEYKYENGRLVWEQMYDPDGSISSYFTYEYDEKGRKMRWNEWLSEGELGCYFTFEYDDADQCIKQNAYEVSGELRYYYVFEYDQSGKQTRQTHYGADGAMVEYEILKYDDKGELQGRERYDASGQLLENYM